ncbi:phosphatidylinositol N-acetylglucosaminyltransferase subunit P [Malania oleifera]|uniref:phosphatidylinositol N-acetylglucosaminyltransferase subunit P n=1 Tax=Malania oleifera TaxID=397392 RepID=UPI0025ADBE63|nr:phosphatidylinositol N-acetylglucosaminyltransferase subunit P [Malania oleifera]XP_057980373.1 phosphatidylinositol N-acetylglucosaminyltransferase subunit P [Malania oleifera]XP_057980374.1 phosphatidylinositol N-acetylglucosaminyltransferase subunit P [Malania oleifera]
MADLRSVSSPRRILSFNKRRRATVFVSDPDDKASGFGLSGDHGPKTSEVYGFVGSITTVVATVIFFIWAYVPEPWLHSIGINYYPSRYWALAVPAYVMVTVVSALGFYIGLNFIATPPPNSLNTMFDEFSREPLSSTPSVEGDEQPIDPIFDIGINQINDLMFNDVK